MTLLLKYVFLTLELYCCELVMQKNHLMHSSCYLLRILQVLDRCYSGPVKRCVITGLEVSTQYCFVLRATNEVGAGPWSPPVTVSTTRMHLKVTLAQCSFLVRSVSVQ